MTELKPLIEYVPEPQRSFLSQPLTLGMFVPCDEEGGLMDAPDLRLLSKEEKKKVNGRYKAAFDRVIFDGFDIKHQHKSSIGMNYSIYNERINLSVIFRDDDYVFANYKRVKTISDLCGLGLKLKER